MPPETELTVAELAAMQDAIRADLEQLREDVAELETLREQVAAFRAELEHGPLAAVALEEARRGLAADYWQARYAGERGATL